MPSKKRLNKMQKDTASDKMKIVIDPNKIMSQLKLSNDKTDKNDKNEKRRRMQAISKNNKSRTGSDRNSHDVDIVESKDNLSVDTYNSISSSIYEISTDEDASSVSKYSDEEEEQEDEESEVTISSSSEYFAEELYELEKIDLADIENFMTDLEKMPNLSEILLHMREIINDKDGVQENAKVTVPDFGRFVKLVDDSDDSNNDLSEPKDTTDTGIYTNITEKTDMEVDEEYMEEMEDEDDEDGSPYEVKEEDFSFDFSANDQLFEDIDEQRIKTEIDEKDSLGSVFVDFITIDDAQYDEYEDYCELGSSEEDEQKCAEVVQEFLQNVIDECVNKSEIMDTSAFLQRHLKKLALLKTLYDIIPQWNVEQTIRQFLNQKCVEYYRRLRAYGRITDTPKSSGYEAERQYIYIINDLDKMLGREKATIERVKYLKTSLLNELEECQHQLNEHTHKFETLFSQSLNPFNSPKMQLVIESCLRNISEARKEVTHWRFKIIQLNHTAASLHKQLKELEDLGNGLSMATYDAIQTDNVSLWKKLEERTTDLNRLRYRCHSNIHVMAHLIERVKMLRDAITIQKSFLQKKQIEKGRIRKSIALRKAKHSSLSKDIREWSARSGLLYKPVVLADYYTTIEEIQKRSIRRSQLRTIIKQKRRRIAGLLQYNCTPPTYFDNFLLGQYF